MVEVKASRFGFGQNWIFFDGTIDNDPSIVMARQGFEEASGGLTV